VWDPGEGEIWGRPLDKTYNGQSYMLPPGEYKRGVGWTCLGDSAFCQIILVLAFNRPAAAEGLNRARFNRVPIDKRR